jgi:RecA-family ATPase
MIVFSAEDDEDELHRRVDDILRSTGQSYSDLEALTVRSLAGEDALLALDRQVKLTASSLFDELEVQAAQQAPALIVIDTLADV